MNCIYRGNKLKTAVNFVREYNFIGIGNLLYFIYGVARSIHAIEDYEQRKQAATFAILMVVSIATVIFLFKALAASFADLTG